MKLRVADRDRSSDLGGEVREAARRHRDAGGPRFRAPEHSALALKQARTEAEYHDRFLELLKIRPDLDTSPFDAPGRPGFAGRLASGVRRLLWRVLRYQHDRMAFQQSGMTRLLIHTLECEKADREKEIARLEKRIEELEARAR